MCFLNIETYRPNETFKTKLTRVLCGAETWYISESRPEMSGKLWNLVLEKGGEDQLDRSCEEWGSVTYRQGGEECPAYSKKEEG